MIRGIFALAGMDLLLWRRSPFAVFSALVPPIGMTAMLVILSLTVLQQPVALVVNSHGPNTTKMQKIIEADDDAYILTVTNKTRAEELLKSQLIAGVISIPEDFEKTVPLYKGRVTLTLNNVDIDFADDIRRSVDRSISQFDAPQLSLDEEEEGEAPEETAEPVINPDEPNPYRINVQKYDLRETNVEWLDYQVLPALVLLVLNVGLMGTALLCSQDVERKTARYLSVSPQSAIALVGGRLLGGFIASIIVLIPAIALGVVMGIITPPLTHWPALIIVFACTALCASGIGACIGSLIKGTRTVAMLGSIISIYLFFLGGGFTTIEFLPPWLRAISAYDPMRYAIDGMRQALFYTTLDGITRDILILCVTALVAMSIGAITIRKTFRE
jgi:ABC-2 type transport system permease protein